MAMICVYGGKICDGSCLDRCEPLDDKVYCDYCEERIYDYYYEIDGKCICKQCLEDLFRKDVD